MTLPFVIQIVHKTHSRFFVPQNAQLEVRRNPAILRAYTGSVNNPGGQQTVFEVCLTEDYRKELVEKLGWMLAGSGLSFLVRKEIDGLSLLSVLGERSPNTGSFRLTLTPYLENGLVATKPSKIWVLDESETQELLDRLS